VSAVKGVSSQEVELSTTDRGSTPLFGLLTQPHLAHARDLALEAEAGQEINYVLLIEQRQFPAAR
jgi:hypothetical protein